MSAATRYERVFSTDEIEPGMIVGYNGRRMPSTLDWLRVSRVEGGQVFGYRTVPEEWEREVEFTIVARQIEDNGVVIDRG